jgi:excisionase family DNA binding protein
LIFGSSRTITGNAPYTGVFWFIPFGIDIILALVYAYVNSRKEISSMYNDVPTIEAVLTLKIPGYMTTEEAADYLDITSGRVRQLVSMGVLPKEKIGNSNLIPIESIKQYAANRPKAGWPKGKFRK